jgi:helicase SWR1
MPSDGTEQGVGGFANLKEFQDWFKKPSEQILEHGRDQMDDESRAIISKLHKVLRPYLLRRLKADVERQMPGKYEHVEFCRLSKRQRELYDGFLNREDTRGTLASGNYLSIINCLMQLRKVCNHPDLFIDRPIMTSFPMEKSAIADFEIKDLLVRRRLLQQDPMTKVSLEFLNLVPTAHETLSDYATGRVHALSAQKTLMDMREAQRTRAQNAFTSLDPSTAKSNLVYLESASRWGRFEELQHCVYLNALRRQQKPIYGTKKLELLTIGISERPFKPRPKRRDQMLTWLFQSSPVLRNMVHTLSSRSESLNSTIQKFACVTPPVIARDMTPLFLTPKGVNAFQATNTNPGKDPFHEARMRLSIQFPDKRLLQYDCGKLQTLAKLLRKLQAGGHRALIFTQMTKVLDILEQFLNIHGHKYLRLDGSTKVEQRQILTDRFNNDTRILAFILSSRSGGLGINLTGADTVIFYDLDWNPAMDKQCQDRCHRIGQTRDVHIYRLVSEHTIEANILRKANQKRMLDDVVIQEGEFTTDYFNKMSVRDVLDEESSLLDGDAAANAAMDRVLGGTDNDKDVQRVLAQAEDREDVVAARVAEREIVQTDAADFDENAVTASATPAVPGTPLEGGRTLAAEGTPALDGLMEVDEEDELNAWGQHVQSTDAYMLKFMAEQLKDTPIELPKDKNRKRGKDHRHRSHRPR